MAKKILVEKNGIKVNLVIDGKKINFPTEFTKDLEENIYVKKFIKEGYLEVLEEMNEEKPKQSNSKKKPGRKPKSK